MERFLALLMLVGGGPFLAACKDRTGRNRPGEDHEKGPRVVREATKAGSWYSADADRLGRELDRYLVQAKVPEIQGRLVGLVTPHAGYRFSGPTAAYGFKLLGKQRGLKRVIVIGLSHRYGFRGVSVPRYTHYETPFGQLKVDRKAQASLRGKSPFIYHAAAHGPEHSLEMQLPYLRRLRPGVRIVTMLAGRLDEVSVRVAGRRLARLMDSHTAVVASSDLAHRGGRFGYEVDRRSGESLRDAVKRVDFGTLPAIRKLDGPGLLDYCQKTRLTMCGRAPVALMLSTLRQVKGLRVKSHVLHYTTSGDVTGDWSSTVSYLSVALTAAP